MAEGRALKCNHCQYRWQYKGKSTYYATCLRCLRKVPVKSEDGSRQIKLSRSTKGKEMSGKTLLEQKYPEQQFELEMDKYRIG